MLLAEVLSDSTARKDKGEKREKYLAIESLQAYLILSQTEVMVTVYQLVNHHFSKSHLIDWGSQSLRPG